MTTRGAGEQAPGDAVRCLRARRRQQQSELIAADAEGAIGGAHGRADHPSERGQQLVTGGVAIGVVHALQVVEVDDHKGEGTRLANGSGHLARELLLECTMVAEPGQRIDARIEGRPIVGRARLPELGLERRHGSDGPVDRDGCDQGRGGRGGHEGGEDGETAGRRNDDEAGGGDRPDAPEPGNERAAHGSRRVGRALRVDLGLGGRGGGSPRFHGTAH